MAEDPAARYPTARVLADELDQWLAGDKRSGRRLWFTRIYLAIGLVAPLVDRDLGPDRLCSPGSARKEPSAGSTEGHPAGIASPPPTSAAATRADPVSRAATSSQAPRVSTAPAPGPGPAHRQPGNTSRTTVPIASRSNRWPSATDSLWTCEQADQKASGHVTNAIHRSPRLPPRLESSRPEGAIVTADRPKQRPVDRGAAGLTVDPTAPILRSVPVAIVASRERERRQSMGLG